MLKPDSNPTAEIHEEAAGHPDSLNNESSRERNTEGQSGQGPTGNGQGAEDRTRDVGTGEDRFGDDRSGDAQPSEDAAQAACEPIELVQGLPVAVVREKLNIGLRMQDTGSRLLAFYLVEMEGRRLYQDTGHSSAVHYAECRLGMERRRSRELLAVGRKLLELPRMDEAFCRGDISWTQVVMMTRVVSPEHEEAWLTLARKSTCRELALEVRSSRPGSKPRDPEDRKGLAEIRFPISAQVSGLAFQKWELAKKQLSEERGAPISDAECMEILASLLLSTEEDGSLPGRKRARSSLFRLVVRQESAEDPGASDGSGSSGDPGDSAPRASLETEDGPIPLDRVTLECIQCDAEAINDDGQYLEKDSKTDPALRARVLTRDGHRCRSCRSRYELMAHHIVPRAKGGKTRAFNLITLCMRCHGLVHAKLLILVGKNQARVRFVDREGRALHDKGEPLPPSVLTRLDRRRAYDALGEPMGQALSRSLATRLAKGPDNAVTSSGSESPSGSEAPREILTREDIPDHVDSHWWCEHTRLTGQGKNSYFRFEPGFAVESPPTHYLLAQDRRDPDMDDASPTSDLAHRRAPWPIRIGHPAAEPESSQTAPPDACLAGSLHGSEAGSQKTAFERRWDRHQSVGPSDPRGSASPVASDSSARLG